MEVATMKIEAVISFILNIVLGALVFTWACANMPVAAATAIGVAVLVVGLVFSISFPKLVSGEK